MGPVSPRPSRFSVCLDHIDHRRGDGRARNAGDRRDFVGTPTDRRRFDLVDDGGLSRRTGDRKSAVRPYTEGEWVQAVPERPDAVPMRERRVGEAPMNARMAVNRTSRNRVKPVRGRARNSIWTNTGRGVSSHSFGRIDERNSQDKGQKAGRHASHERCSRMSGLLAARLADRMPQVSAKQSQPCVYGERECESTAEKASDTLQPSIKHSQAFEAPRRGSVRVVPWKNVGHQTRAFASVPASRPVPSRHEWRKRLCQRQP